MADLYQSLFHNHLRETPGWPICPHMLYYIQFQHDAQALYEIGIIEHDTDIGFRKAASRHQIEVLGTWILPSELAADLAKHAISFEIRKQHGQQAFLHSRVSEPLWHSRNTEVFREPVDRKTIEHLVRDTRNIWYKTRKKEREDLAKQKTREELERRAAPYHIRKTAIEQRHLANRDLFRKVAGPKPWSVKHAWLLPVAVAAGGVALLAGATHIQGNATFMLILAGWFYALYRALEWTGQVGEREKTWIREGEEKIRAMLAKTDSAYRQAISNIQYYDDQLRRLEAHPNPVSPARDNA